MKNQDINIRDPFVLKENGVYYLYGTRAKGFGQNVSGFDVYKSTDLENWSEPIEVFNSEIYGLNNQVNWAPEVHKYNGSYYMFATFSKENQMRGTHILKADSPEGPFVPHSNGAVTPDDWMSLDGTLYVSKDKTPYIVFCHEHVQIVDGTICYARLSDDLKEITGEIVTLFSASSPSWADKKPQGESYVTDGPFLKRTKDDELIMFWSTFIKHQYAVCMVKFKDGEIGTEFQHLEPLITNDGGHAMVFDDNEKTYISFHTPNKSLYERPSFIELSDKGTHFELKK